MTAVRAESPMRPPVTILDGILDRGQRHVAHHYDIGEYASRAEASPELAAINCIRAILWKDESGFPRERILLEMFMRETLLDILRICPEHGNGGRMGVNEILQSTAFRSLTSEQVTPGSPGFRQFLVLLERLANMTGTAALVLAKRPDVLTVLKISVSGEDVFIIFDVRRRSEHPDGPAFIVQTSMEGTANDLAYLLRYNPISNRRQAAPHFSAYFVASMTSIGQMGSRLSVERSHLTRGGVDEARLNENGDHHTSDTGRSLPAEPIPINPSATQPSGPAPAASGPLPSQSHSPDPGSSTNPSDPMSRQAPASGSGPFHLLHPPPPPIPSQPGSPRGGPATGSTLPAHRDSQAASREPSSSRRIYNSRDRTNRNAYPTPSTTGSEFPLGGDESFEIIRRSEVNSMDDESLSDHSLYDPATAPSVDPEIVCPNCLGVLPASRFAQADLCSHSFCRQCIRNRIRYHVATGVLPIRCRLCEDERAPGVLSLAVARRVGFTDRDNEVRVLEVREMDCVHVWCPRCNGSHYMDKARYDAYDLLTCPARGCEHTWCRRCGADVQPHVCSGTSIDRNLNAPHDNNGPSVGDNDNTFPPSVQGSRQIPNPTPYFRPVQPPVIPAPEPGPSSRPSPLTDLNRRPVIPVPELDTFARRAVLPEHIWPPVIPPQPEPEPRRPVFPRSEWHPVIPPPRNAPAPPLSQPPQVNPVIPPTWGWPFFIPQHSNVPMWALPVAQGSVRQPEVSQPRPGPERHFLAPQSMWQYHRYSTAWVPAIQPLYVRV